MKADQFLRGVDMSEIQDQWGKEMKEDSWEKWAKSLVDRYQAKLKYYPPRQMDTSKVIQQSYGTGVVPLRHVRWMLGEMSRFVAGHRVGRFNKWLGFVQGVLCSFAIYSIDEMHEHNRGAGSDG